MDEQLALKKLKDLIGQGQLTANDVSTDSAFLAHFLDAAMLSLGFTHNGEASNASLAWQYRHPASSMTFQVKFQPFESTKLYSEKKGAASSSSGGGLTSASPDIASLGDRRPIKWLLVSAMALEVRDELIFVH